MVINEGITLHSVIFYMAFIVEGRDKLVLAFQVWRKRLAGCLRSQYPVFWLQSSKPPLRMLQEVYRGTEAMLFDNRGEGATESQQKGQEEAVKGVAGVNGRQAGRAGTSSAGRKPPRRRSARLRARGGS